MENEDKRVRSYYEPDGTKVIETVTLIRIHPKEGEFSGTNILEVHPNFYKQMLDYTNELRARHQAPPLILCDFMNTYAQEWANHLAQINKCIHRIPNQYGENLFYKYQYSKIILNGREPVQQWYDEIEDYYPYFGKDPPKSVFGKVGHFTNLVWKDTKRMGVGYAKGINTVYVVCNYDPPGNMFTMFKDNVMPLCEQPLEHNHQKDRNNNTTNKVDISNSDHHELMENKQNSFKQQKSLTERERNKTKTITVKTNTVEKERFLFHK